MKKIFIKNCEKKKTKRKTSGPPGFHTTARELQTYTFKGPGASNTTKFPREDPQRKSENGGGRGKKKREILGGPAEGGPGRGSRAGGPAQGVSGGGNEKKSKKSKHLKNN